MANFVGGIEILDSVADFATLPELSGAREVTTTVINGLTYIFVVSEYDDGIQVMRVENDQLVPVFSITDSASTGLDGAVDVGIVTTGGNTYLVVVGYGDDALSTFRIDTSNTGTDGHLTPVATLYDNSNSGTVTTLQNAYALETFQTPGGAYVVTTAYTDDAVTAFRVNPDGTMTPTSAIADSADPDLNLDNAFYLAGARIGSNNYVYVGSASADAGFSAFRLSDAGVLTNIQNIELGGSRYVTGVATAIAGGTQYLVISEDLQNELITYAIANDGTLTEVSRFQAYTAPVQFNTLEEIETVYINGVPFIMAGLGNDDGIAMFSLADDGTIARSELIKDTINLNGVYGLSSFTADGRTFLLGAARDGGRVTLLEVGAGDDVLIGTTEADRIVGLGGNDELLGRGGEDVIRGGTGDDLLSGGVDNDSLVGDAGDDVLSGGMDNDTLMGGQGADFLSGGQGRDMISYSTSQVAVSINLRTGLAQGGDAQGDLFGSIEDVMGSPGRDTIYGDSQDNTLVGLNGGDRIYGDNGNDFINALGARDTLFGGNGNDTLLGGTNDDSLRGEAGADRLDGQGGQDIIIGGGGNDTLLGGLGNDTLLGEVGDDILTGNGGFDVFHFAGNFRNDTITDFSLTQDKIDFRVIAEFNSLADVQAAAVSFGGNTVISLSSGLESILIMNVLESQLTEANFLF